MQNTPGISDIKNVKAPMEESFLPHRLTYSRSLHKTVLNLVETAVPVLEGQVVMRQLLSLGHFDLPEQVGLVQ